MEKRNKILLLSNIVLIGFFIAVVFHYILGFYMNLGYSFNTFLSEPYRAFDDFLGLLPKIKSFNPYTPPADWQNYFPLAYLILIPFAYIKNQLLSYFLFLYMFLTFFIYTNIKFFNCKSLNKFDNFQNIFILTFLSYPFLCLVDRGNFDMIVLIFSMLFVLFFQKEKYSASAITLGIINALKPFSLLFLFLFLFEKKYKEFFLSIITTLLLIIGGFMIFKGSILDQFSVMLTSFIYVKQLFLFNLSGATSNGSSLFIALKFLLCSFNHFISVASLIKIYNVITLFITFFTVFFLWKEKEFWKKITLLTLYMLTIPYAVFDYKLILLFVPLWLFIEKKEKSKFDLAYTICFGLLLIPKRYIIVFGLIHKINLILFSIVANPLIMLTFMGLIIVEQFRQKKAYEND